MGEAVWKEQGNRGGEATDQLSLDLPVGGWEEGRVGTTFPGSEYR